MFFQPCLAATLDKLSCTYTYSHQDVVVQGRHALVEYYRPSGHGPFPLVLILHGATGALTSAAGGEPSLSLLGEKAFARSCYMVVLPHYLELIGHKSLLDRADMNEVFPLLFKLTDLLLDDAEHLPEVHGEPVFVFGQSLGGYLAASIGIHRSEVAGVSELSGGLAPRFQDPSPHFLRVLIWHGEDDNVVSPDEATVFSRYCTEHKLAVATHLIPNAGHYVPNATLTTIVQQTIESFDRIAEGSGPTK